MSFETPLAGKPVPQGLMWGLKAGDNATQVAVEVTAAGAIKVDTSGGSASGRSLVEPLGVPGVARQQTATSTSQNIALTTSVTRCSLYARNADIRYLVGSTSQTASATSHFLGIGERIDIALPATPNIGVIRAGSVDGVLEISELS